MKAHDNRLAKGNLKAFIATGGVLASAGTAGQAAIVYTDISDLTVSFGSTIYFSLTAQAADTSGAVNEQFRLNFFMPTPNYPRILGVLNSGAAAGYAGAFYSYASRLANGATINGALSFSTSSQLAYYSAGPWNPGNRGYLGLRFDNGGQKFGWADVEYTAGSQLKLYSFAFEDSGGQILAGAVPESAATGAIAVVFAGSVAAFESRRRRKAAKLAAAQPEPNTAS